MRDLTPEEKARYNDLIEATLSKQESFFQQFLLVSSALLGIVVSLHSTSSQCLCIRLVFLVALVLLSLGVLANLIVVFDFLRIRERARKAYLDELNNAARNNRPMDYIGVGWKKRTLFCRKAALICFVTGLIALTLYSVLIVLAN